jgi:hypothetical protein
MFKHSKILRQSVRDFNSDDVEAHNIIIITHQSTGNQIITNEIISQTFSPETHISIFQNVSPRQQTNSQQCWPQIRNTLTKFSLDYPDWTNQIISKPTDCNTSYGMPWVARVIYRAYSFEELQIEDRTNVGHVVPLIGQTLSTNLNKADLQLLGCIVYCQPMVTEYAHSYHTHVTWRRNSSISRTSLGKLLPARLLTG